MMGLNNLIILSVLNIIFLTMGKLQKIEVSVLIKTKY